MCVHACIYTHAYLYMYVHAIVLGRSVYNLPSWVSRTDYKQCRYGAVFKFGCNGIVVDTLVPLVMVLLRRELLR